MKFLKETTDFEVFTSWGGKLDLVVSYDPDSHTVEYYMRDNKTGEALIRRGKKVLMKRVMPETHMVLKTHPEVGHFERSFAKIK